MMGAMILPAVHTVSQVAARLGRSRRTVERLIRAGQLEVVRPHQRPKTCTLITDASVQDFERRQAAKT
jgi:excisionase family DNA binding protein